MTWGEFRDQFAKFFPISNHAKKELKLKSEYIRLTGINPDEQHGQDIAIHGEAKKDKRRKSRKGSIEGN